MSIAIVPTLARAPIAATPGEATIRETSAPAGARVGGDFASILLGLPLSVAEVPSPASQEGNRLEVDSLLLRLPLAGTGTSPTGDTPDDSEPASAEAGPGTTDPALLATLGVTLPPQPTRIDASEGVAATLSEQTRAGIPAAAGPGAQLPPPGGVPAATGKDAAASPPATEASGGRPADFAATASALAPTSAAPSAASPPAVSAWASTSASASTAQVPELAASVDKVATTPAVPVTAALNETAVSDGISGNNLQPPPSLHGLPGLQSVQALEKPLHDRSWATDLGQKLLWFVSNDKQGAQLTLNPPQLGSIEITIHMDKNGANAHFASPNPDVRGAIETAVPRLREMFAGAGIDLGQVSVGSESFRQQSDGQQDTSQRPRILADKAILGGGSAGGMPGATAITRHGSSLVDTFA